MHRYIVHMHLDWTISMDAVQWIRGKAAQWPPPSPPRLSALEHSQSSVFLWHWPFSPYPVLMCIFIRARQTLPPTSAAQQNSETQQKAPWNACPLGQTAPLSIVAGFLKRDPKHSHWNLIWRSVDEVQKTLSPRASPVLHCWGFHSRNSPLKTILHLQGNRSGNSKGIWRNKKGLYSMVKYIVHHKTELSILTG